MYAQLFRITLAPSVLPRLLAQILAGASFARHVIIHSHASMFLLKEFYKQYTLHHSRDIAGSHFRALSMIPHCCLPWEPGPCLSPSVADHPLRPAKDLWLGAPFPHQLSNLLQAYLFTTTCFFKAFNFFKEANSYIVRTRSLQKNSLFVQLACVKPIASVHSEPGSNS